MNGVALPNVTRPRMPQPRPIFRTKAYITGPPPSTIARPITTAPLPVKPKYPKRSLPQGLRDTRLNRNMPTRLKQGDLVEGIVTSVADFGVFVKLSHNNSGLVHISRVSHVKVDNLADIFRPGDKIKAIVAAEPSNPRKLVLSTKKLETTPGQILDDAEGAFQAAEATVASFNVRPEDLVSPFYLGGVPA